MYRIKEILKERNMTMVELADKLGIHRVTLSQTISGNPKIDTLKRIADALDVNVLDLFEDNRPKKTTLICPGCGKELNIEIKE